MTFVPLTQINGQTRVWTDSTGEFTVEADFESLDEEGVVTLVGAEGRRFSLVVERLSHEDQEIARFLSGGGGEALADLISENRQERIDAIKKIGGGPVPGFAKPFLLKLLALEVASLNAGVRRLEVTPPRVGDEVSLLKVKADPLGFVDKPLIVLGRLTVSSYYNYGYSNAERTHYSMDFDELTASGERGENIQLYVPRQFSAPLVDRVSESRDGLVLRAKVKLSGARYDGASSWDLMEVIDWQYYSERNQGWQPWMLDGLRESLALFGQIRDATAMADVLASKEVHGARPEIDVLVREIAIEVAKNLSVQEEDLARVTEVIASSSSLGATKELDRLARSALVKSLATSSPAIRRGAVRELRKLAAIARRRNDEITSRFAAHAAEVIDSVRN
ncbi:SHD1 domain-containing protein [Rhodopirellula europaea]|uniref:SHD1 domain-containing protein n=1 Tax=Rhodopirellula europaea TaxID=1263866 RepID=UPI003D292B61